jgi:hypothetical protein
VGKNNIILTGVLVCLVCIVTCLASVIYSCHVKDKIHEQAKQHKKKYITTRRPATGEKK